MDHFMPKFAGFGAPPELIGSGQQDISFPSQFEAVKMALNKLVEAHPKDKGKSATKGRIVYLGCMVNDFIESNNTSQNSINSQKWRKGKSAPTFSKLDTVGKNVKKFPRRHVSSYIL